MPESLTIRARNPRRWRTAATACLMLISTALSHASAQDKKPEDPSLTIAVSVTDSTFLPIYLAEDAGLFKAEGLNPKILSFHGGSDLTRAVVAQSVQIGLASPTSVLSAISAGQNVKVFFGGFNQAPFSWYAVPPINWS